MAKYEKESVISVTFDVDSDAYEALSLLRRQPATDTYVISQCVLMKREGDLMIQEDGFDTGIETANDTWRDGIIGGLVGILGGPIGMLLGGSVGALIGNIKDDSDAKKNASIMEYVFEKTNQGKTAMLVLVRETEENAFNKALGKYAATFVRADAGVIAQEVEQAEELEKTLRKETRKKLKDMREANNYAAEEEKRQELKEKFDRHRDSSK